MDDGSISPRRALPPVPPARSGGTLLAPPAPAADQTTWFDSLDPMNDSMLQTAVGTLGPLDDGTAAKAARDLIRESGRQPVLDEALLEALDAAAKAAAARRAVTVDLPTGFTAAPAARFDDATADGFDDDVEDESADDDTDDESATARSPATALSPAIAATPVITPAITPARPVPPRPVPVRSLTARPLTAPVDVPQLDVAAEFARHDDLVTDMAETGRHVSLDDTVHDTGRHAIDRFTDSGRHLAVDPDLHDELHDGDRDERADDSSATGVPVVGTLTHRTVVTRSSGRRWIPVGVGAGVLSIVAAVLLTSGFAANGPATGTDEAARTGASTPATTAPATTPSLPAPAMNTLDLSGPVVVDESTQRDDASVDAGRPSTSASRSTAAPAVQPQVATPPSAGTPSTDTTSSVETTTASPSTLTAEVPPSSVSSSSSSSSSSAAGSSTSTSN